MCRGHNGSVCTGSETCSPTTEVGKGKKATHNSCESASHIRAPSKRLTRWNSTLCAAQKLAMNKKLVKKASTPGQLSRRLPSSSRPWSSAAASGRISSTAKR